MVNVDLAYTKLDPREAGRRNGIWVGGFETLSAWLRFIHWNVVPTGEAERRRLGLGVPVQAGAPSAPARGCAKGRREKCCKSIRIISNRGEQEGVSFPLRGEQI